MSLVGPYSASISRGKCIISYTGNKVFGPLKDVSCIAFDRSILDKRLGHICDSQEYFYHLHRIDHGVFLGAVNYFQSIGAEWCNLPLTTLMISSPGEVYAGKTLDYTTDTLPVDIAWFGNKRKIFLSESSQFYLELRLLLDSIEKVFSIYNSFRKERADFCHLSEFQHIEFEGRVSFADNIDIALGLASAITRHLVKSESESLTYFLGEAVDQLEDVFAYKNIETLSFKDALKILRDDTGNNKYNEFSLKNFGAWEEVRLTEILKKHVILTKFPLVQIPFYHNEVGADEDGVPLAENADFIFFGYRETIGSGTRIADTKALMEKAKLFNLPPGDYDPYIALRARKEYKTTSGFGLGWQRYVQWLLRLPFIWDATHIPRGHHLPRP